MPETTHETAPEKKPDDAAPRKQKVGGARPHRNQIALSDPPRRTMTTAQEKECFSWWAKCHQKAPGRVAAKVYRKWPVVLEEPRRHCQFTLVEALPTPEAFYAKVGCGDYYVYFNDGNNNDKTVAEIMLRGFRDLNNYPPVLDLEKLSWDDPANQDYIRTLQLKGILPSREDRNMENQNAGAAAAMQEMARGYTALMNNVLRGQQQPRGESIDSLLSAKVIDTVAASAAAGTKMLENSYNESLKLRGQPQQNSELALVEKIFGMVTPLIVRQGEPKENGLTVSDILKQQDEQRARYEEKIERLNDSRFDLMKEELRAIRDEAKNTKPTDGSLENYLKLKSQMEEAGLLEGAEKPDKIARYLALAGSVAPALASLGQSLAGALFNYAASRNPNVRPVPPPTEEEIRRQQLAAASPEQQQQAMFVQFLDSISEALVNHFQSDTLNGGDFADWLIRGKRGGIGVYRSLKEREEPKTFLVQLLQSHAGLWSELGSNPQTLDRFLDEFLDYDDQPQPDDSEQQPSGVTQ